MGRSGVDGREYEPDQRTDGYEEVGGSKVIRDSDFMHGSRCWVDCFFREEERGTQLYLHGSITVEPDLQAGLQRVAGRMRFVMARALILGTRWEEEAGRFSH